MPLLGIQLWFYFFTDKDVKISVSVTQSTTYRNMHLQ